MGLSNAAKRARDYSQTIVQNQGGGSKKAGFPYQVGRSTQTSIALNSTDPVSGQCCTLPTYQTNLVFANISRSIGRNNAQAYWKSPGVPGSS